MVIDKETKKRIEEKILQEHPNYKWRIDTFVHRVARWESSIVLSNLYLCLDEIYNDFQIRDISIYSVMDIRQCSYMDALFVMEAIYECEEIADFYKPDNENFYKKLLNDYPIDVDKFAEKLISEGIKDNKDEAIRHAKSLLNIIEPLIQKYLYFWINGESPNFLIHGMPIFEVMKNMKESYYESLIVWMDLLIKKPNLTLESVTPGSPYFYDPKSMRK